MRNGIFLLLSLSSFVCFAQPLWEQKGLLPCVQQEARSCSAAHWLWRDEIPTSPGSVCYFRCMFDVPTQPKQAKLSLRADDFGTIYLNGEQIAPVQFQKTLRVGRNLLAVRVENAANVAGLLFAADITCVDGQKIRVVSDTKVRVSDQGSEGWNQIYFDDASWSPATDQGDVLQIPWSNRFDYTRDYASDAERAQIVRDRLTMKPYPEGLEGEGDPKVSLMHQGHKTLIRVNADALDPAICLFNESRYRTVYPKNLTCKLNAMGWRLFEISVNPSDYECTVGTYDFTATEKSVRELLYHAPNAYISLSLNLELPKWCAQHPSETIVYADPSSGTVSGDEFRGTPVRPSAASKAYRAEVSRVLATLGGALAQAPWGKRIFAVRVNWGVYTEWHMYGMQHAPDVSEPMVHSFGRAAPTLAERRVEDHSLDDKVHANLMAWNRHQQEVIADMLIAFTQDVKRFIPGRLAGAYYGYIWDIFVPEGSNCLLGKVLDAPSVDFLSAPSPYFGGVRLGGGSYHSRSIPDAFTRRGKLFLCEDDTRHYHTRGWAFERHLVPTPELSAAVMKRNYLNTLFDGGGIQFCDPFYGVGLRHNTFDDPVVLKALYAAREAASHMAVLPREEEAETIVVVSERERLLRGSALEKKPDMYWRNLYSYLPNHLYRSGHLFSFMRFEDFLQDTRKPKRAVLLNIVHMTDAERKALAQRTCGVTTLDMTRETIPDSAAAWRARLSAAGSVPAAPLNTYCRRVGDYFMFHTGEAGAVDVRPGLSSTKKYVELFSGQIFPGGDILHLTLQGPETLVFRIERDMLVHE